MPFIVYILKCADGTFYTGSTNDITKRLHAHNNLKSGAKYTHGRRPVKLVYKQSFRTLKKAKQREYAIKQLTRQEKMNLTKKSRSAKLTKTKMIYNTMICFIL